MITQPGTGVPAAARPKMGPGAAGGQAAPRETHTYYERRADGKWRLRTASIPVPVDQSGAVSHARFRCVRCKTSDGPRFEWVSLAVADKYESVNAAPTCTTCDHRMQRVGIPHANALPVQAILHDIRPYLWPLVALAGTVAVGAGLHASRTHPAAVAVFGLFAAWASARWWRGRLTGRATATNVIADEGMPEKIARDGRVVGYCIAAAFAWATYTCAVGVDPRTMPGLAAWPALAAVWLLPAATYWRHTRNTRGLKPPEPVVAKVEEPVDDRDPDVAYVEWLIQTSLIQTAGDDVPANPPAAVKGEAA